MNELSDEQLVAATLEHGPDAFGAIVRKYQDAVFGVALARLGNFHDAQDVAQAVLIEAYEKLPNLREPAKLGNWLRKMAVYRSLDYRRRQETTQNLDEVPALADKTQPPDDLRERVLEAIGRLARPQREAVTLFYINGYSLAQVASISGTSLSAVKSRLHQARAKLKEDMLHMVEDVLKSKAPDDELGRQVYEAITGSLGWHERADALTKAGPKGWDGLVKAATSSNWRHRRNAFQMQDRLQSAESIERQIELLKQGLSDPNKKVRRTAVAGLMNLPVSEDRKRREFVPLLVERLDDAGGIVRRYAAWLLLPYADLVPVEPVARAFMLEPSASKRWPLTELLKRLTKKN